MLFNSIEFLIFFPVVCAIYFLLKNNRWRIPFLLIASYYFYMNWKPVYAVLIMTSTVLTYLCGLLVEKYSDDKPKKKAFLVISLVINFAILFFFKYYNFINESIFSLLELAGLRWPVPNLDVLLPVGISFYTFQAVGYSIDVYRGTIKAEKNFLTYALFVSFFPQLVAGPIERAKNLLPQFHEEHSFNYNDVVNGLKQMLWGFFMKLCVADVLSEYVNAVFNNLGQHNSISVVIAVFFFTFQIYCDFGGYSNIAIGAARVMGFRLMENFHRPYFSLNIKEFWKRWHISLSSWFMDYVYIPLGGNRVKYPRHLLNLAITFLVSGIWHGANWTFVLWGGIHAMYQVVANVFRKFVYKPKYDVWWSRMFGTIACFVAVAFAWIFFRANNVADAFTIIGEIINFKPDWFWNKTLVLKGCIFITILLFKDFKDERNLDIHFIDSKYRLVRYLTYYALFIAILCNITKEQQFIYFQF